MKMSNPRSTMSPHRADYVLGPVLDVVKDVGPIIGDETVVGALAARTPIKAGQGGHAVHELLGEHQILRKEAGFI